MQQKEAKKLNPMMPQQSLQVLTQEFMNILLEQVYSEVHVNTTSSSPITVPTSK